ncbi:P-loop containing nucleoside triphosphate hydrolase protein [Lipomyces oligophaga]|uniref:P-loop containing nucleoside triphosphate hydrolase protein n=1 Tax=Lipomyces oligophaga TaxID=45792 RepID=UPI0034CF4D6E
MSASTVSFSSAEDLRAYEHAAILFDNIKPSVRSLFHFSSREDIIPLTLTGISLTISAIYPSISSILVGKVISCYSNQVAANLSGNDYNLAAEARPFLLGMFGIGLLCVPLWITIHFSCQWFAENQIRRAKSKLLQTILSRSIPWYDGIESSAGLVAKCDKYLEEFEAGINGNFGNLCYYVSKMLIAIGVAMYFSWRLTLVILASFPVIAVVQSSTNRYINRVSMEKKSTSLSANRIIQWSINALDTVKLLNAQSIEASKFASESKTLCAQSERVTLLFGIQQSISKFFLFALFIVSFWYGGSLVQAGKLQSGTVLTVFWCCNILSHSIANLGPKAMTFQRAQMAAESLFSVIENFPEDSQIFGGCQTPLKGDIEFRNVTFAYPSRSLVPVLRNVSFHVNAGTLSFIVGKSGSGKSTIHQLLIALYKAQTGVMRIDDIDIAQFDMYWLRRQITVVQQNSVLFHDTISNNLNLVSEFPQNFGADDISRALRIALLRETVNNMPDGPETFLSSEIDLSGGQRQRLALARAIVRDSPILILDEATSALDSISRSLIMDAIRLWRRNKTTIVITHDITQIESSDPVVVMENGTVVQAGNRQTLEQNEHGSFMKLVEASLQVSGEGDIDGFCSSEQEASEYSLQIPKQVHLRDSVYSFLETYFTHDRKSCNSIDALQAHFFGFDFSRKSMAGSELTCMSPNTLNAEGNSRNSYSSQYEELMDIAIQTGLKTQESRYMSSVSSRRPSHMSAASSTVSSTLYSSSAENLSIEKATGSIVSVSAGDNTTTTTPTIDSISLAELVKTLVMTQQSYFLLTFGLIFAVLSGSTMPAFSYVFSKLVFSLFPGSNATGVSFKWPILAFLVAFIDSITTFATIWFLEVAGERWIYRLRNLAFRKLLSRDWSWFSESKLGVYTDEYKKSTDEILKQHSSVRFRSLLKARSSNPRAVSRYKISSLAIPIRSSSGLANILISESENAQIILGRLIGPILGAIFMMSIGVIWAFVVGWQLTFVGIAMAPVAAGAGWFMASNASKWTKLYYDESSRFRTLFYEVTTKIRTVQTLNLERYFTSELKQCSESNYRIGLRKGFMLGLGDGLNNFAIISVQVVVFAVGAILISGGVYSVQQVVTVFALIVFSLTNSADILSNLPESSLSKICAINLIRLAMLEPEDFTTVAEQSGFENRVTEFADENSKIGLTFENVWYSYSTEDQYSVPVLNGVNLDIEPGQTVAIVGFSGCGKSTLCSMIGRLLMPTKGHIRLTKKGASMDLHSVNVEDLRTLIAVVSQNLKLSSGTIYQNLVYGLSGNREEFHERVVSACKKSKIHDFVMSLPDGYNTYLESESTKLSGGQIQRLAIARALLREPRILILDECTSALDSESSNQIREVIVGSVMSKTTIVMITHAQELMQVAEKVVVLDDGIVVEQGSFDELLARGGYLVNLLTGKK